jgi:hypothetical protein
MNMPRKGKEDPIMWKQGKVSIDGKEYSYTAKVFDEPSHFGIDDGKVSILSIRNEDGKEVVNYSRGWDIKPKGVKIKKAYAEVMNIIAK